MPNRMAPDSTFESIDSTSFDINRYFCQIRFMSKNVESTSVQVESCTVGISMFSYPQFDVEIHKNIINFLCIFSKQCCYKKSILQLSSCDWFLTNNVKFGVTKYGESNCAKFDTHNGSNRRRFDNLTCFYFKLRGKIGRMASNRRWNRSNPAPLDSPYLITSGSM